MEMSIFLAIGAWSFYRNLKVVCGKPLVKCSGAAGWVTAVSLCCFCNVALIFATMKTFILQQVKCRHLSSSPPPPFFSFFFFSPPSVHTTHSPLLIAITFFLFTFPFFLVPSTLLLSLSLHSHGHLPVEKKPRCCSQAGRGADMLESPPI